MNTERLQQKNPSINTQRRPIADTGSLQGRKVEKVIKGLTIAGGALLIIGMVGVLTFCVIYMAKHPPSLGEYHKMKGWY